jgi:hypothetical protein
MTCCQWAGRNAGRLALAVRIKVVKEIISGTHTAELFVQCLESQMERHEGCSLKMQESRKEKDQNQVKTMGGYMQPGEKLNLTRSIRSPKTGSLLPKEGTLVSVTENLGRTLLLVEFARGHREYVFENEVEIQSDHSSREKYDVHAGVHVF